MASEAQRLIGISLTKIAQSRSHRGGVSLHKNLLVATVLQKARYIFMEEAYNMVHYQPQAPVPVQPRPAPEEEELVGLTAEEALADVQESPAGLGQAGDQLQELLQAGCSRCAENNQDKENQPPAELTYLDLDKGRERGGGAAAAPGVGGAASPGGGGCLKRRRAVSEWETEEAVQSILPKRSRTEDVPDADDSVFLDDASLLSEAVSREQEAEAKAEQQQQRDQETSSSSSSAGAAMEIDRITSLVSIFSFSMGDGKLTRSVSTPDLCSAQAKDTPDGIQQRPFLAMTV